MSLDEILGRLDTGSAARAAVEIAEKKPFDVLVVGGGPAGVSTGARWRHLGVPGEEEYKNKGVHFCPHCDGPFYKGKRIAVIGGGNSGVEAAIDLAGVVGHVTVVE